jgi:hypothetical protein
MTELTLNCFQAKIVIFFFYNSNKNYISAFYDGGKQGLLYLSPIDVHWNINRATIQNQKRMHENPKLFKI